MGDFGLRDLGVILGGLVVFGVGIVTIMMLIAGWPMIAQLAHAARRRYLVITWPDLVTRLADDHMSTSEGVPDFAENSSSRRSDAVEHDREQPGTAPVFRRSDGIAWLEQQSDDALLDILAALQTADGDERFSDSRIAKFIGGRIEDRIAQVRDARAKDAPMPIPPRAIPVRPRAGEERILVLD